MVSHEKFVPRMQQCHAAKMEAKSEESTSLLSEDETEIGEKTTNYRRLITGGIVLVLVVLLWVGSAELSDVCNCTKINIKIIEDLQYLIASGKL